ncbi:hypothetical protein [Streptomyces sp. NPDC055189]
MAMEIQQLPGLYRECEDVLTGTRSVRLRSKITGGSLPGIPLNTAAVEVRSEVLTLLATWSCLVAEERRVTPPPYTVDGMTAFLSRHVSWLGAHPAVGEASEEIARAHARARRVARPEVPHRLTVGPCAQRGCEGTLNALLYGRAGERSDTIVCDLDPAHSWPGHEWTRLQQLLESGPAGAEAGRTGSETGDAGEEAGRTGATTEKWLTASQVSALFTTPTGTVYRLASQHAWRRRRHAGRTYYAVTDIRSSLADHGTPAS